VDTTNGLIWVMALLLAGTAISALISRWRRLVGWVSFAFVLAASILVLCLSAFAWLGKASFPGKVLFHIPILNSNLVFGIDGISALFLAVIAVLGSLSALYSVGYIAHPYYGGESLARYYPFMLLFILGMIGVVVSWDLFMFLIFWELMTLASYFLVIFEKEKRVNLRAGFKYFVMTHIGTACLIAAFIILRLVGGSFGFDDSREAMEALGGSRPGLFSTVLLLMFIGFGTKAAIFPLGDWLPDAHPAAPSAISALLSGVMIKMGVYGILRCFLWMGPSSHSLAIWGGIIAFFGALSLFICTMEALVQRDSKRLLAFSSIGQMGYIFLGIGIGIAFLRISPALSAAGFIGGLYHLLNHASFKGLLFLNAGSALISAGTRDLDRLGGLYKFMPLTTFTALIASFSIAGVPPLNGFGSKWLLYQVSLFCGLQAPIYMAYGIAAIFISAVTLAYSIKFLGAIFFGQPSANITGLLRKGPMEDVPTTMRVAQMALALVCIGFGIIPMIPISAAHYAISTAKPGFFPGLNMLFSGSFLGLSLNLGEGITGIWNPVVMAIAFAICFLIPLGIYMGARGTVRVVEPWVCGEVHDLDEIRYKAAGFYLTFRTLSAPRLGGLKAMGFYPRWPIPRAGWLRALRYIFNFDYLYYAFVKGLMKLFDWFSLVHVGYPQVYVLWMAVGLAIAILLLYLLP